MLESAPPGAVTVIVPVVAPAGTCARMLVSETTVNVACVSLNATAVVPVRLFPKMDTVLPALPKLGTASTNGARSPDKLKMGEK